MLIQPGIATSPCDDLLTNATALVGLVIRSSTKVACGCHRPDGQIVFTLCPRQTRRRRASSLCACGAAGVVPATGLRTCVDG